MHRKTGDRKCFMLLFLHVIVLLQSSLSEDALDSCSKIEMVTREEWLARKRARSYYLKLPVDEVIIHHTVTTACRTKQQCIREMQFLQNYHIDYLTWGDIAYNFLVGGDSRVYEGVGWTIAGTHTINYNSFSIGIAYFGNFMEAEPNQTMVETGLRLIKCGIEKGHLTPTAEIHGHRDVACSYSPGDKLYNYIRQWANYKGGRMPMYNC